MLLLSSRVLSGKGRTISDVEREHGIGLLAFDLLFCLLLK